MIDPAGDARFTGRVVTDVFERSISMQAAQTLKQIIEKKYPNTRIILTRHPGEILEPLQNAIFANRLHVDLFLSIHCYQATSTTPRCNIYHFTYNPLAQSWYKKTTGLKLTPLHQAYYDTLQQSRYIAETLYTKLQANDYRSKISTETPRAFPCKPLLGVATPAIMIELGIAQHDDWKMIIDAIGKELEC